MEFCRRKWPWDPGVKPDSVVLIGLFPDKIATYCNAHMANDLARRKGAGIEAFRITTRASPIVQKVYASCGARVRLDASFAEGAEPKLRKTADEMFAALESKWDLLELECDGIKIGDLVYDSFLRYYSEPTVILDDPRLRDIIFQTLLVYTATTNYLKARNVIGFIADDYSYHENGTVTRVMMRANVPVYLALFGPQYFIYRLSGEPETGGYNYPIRWPFHHFRKLFQALPAEEQIRCREKGRRHLDEKLAGKLDAFTLVNITAYAKSEGKVFPGSGKPRVLVLMHDFFDSPHGYRWMLFPDFYEWCCFLFERASETPFEWYVKPHPSAWDAKKGSLNESNRKIINELQTRFPKIRFLAPTVSNRAIVEEGISAMFTMYGTAGHEFARMGIPVVNAGDNPHIAYEFNYHPRTIEEYADLIARADRLPCSADADDIAEFVYMNYFYFAEHCSTGANPLSEEFFADPNYHELCTAPNGYDRLIAAGDDEWCEAKMNKYYDEFYRNDLSLPVPAWEPLLATAMDIKI